MHHIIDNFFSEEFDLDKNVKFNTMDLLFLFFLTAFAIIARFSLFEFASNDYTTFLSPWFQELKAAGGINGIGLPIGDYTPPYIYIMTLLTLLPIDSLISIKLVSCIFDFACAFVIMASVYRRHHNVQKSILAYGCVLFLPTILLNSAMWAQCDVIFTFFLVLCVFSFTKNKPLSATVYFAIAFCFKLQAIFLFPLLILMWLKNKMRFSHFLLIPAIYVVSIVPSFLMGRPISQLLTIYISQSSQYQDLSLNAPNLYIWLNSDNGRYLSATAIAICACVVLCILYIAYNNKFLLNSDTIISFALLFALVVPFFLPHMHERYFYTADVFAVIYAFHKPKRWFIAAGVGLSSLLSYCPYLFGIMPIKLSMVALVMLAMIIYVAYDIKKSAILIEEEPLSESKIA